MIWCVHFPFYTFPEGNWQLPPLAGSAGTPVIIALESVPTLFLPIFTIIWFLLYTFCCIYIHIIQFSNAVKRQKCKKNRHFLKRCSFSCFCSFIVLICMVLSVLFGFLPCKLSKQKSACCPAFGSQTRFCNVMINILQDGIRLYIFIQ